MNVRRYALFLVVAILTFLTGVAATVLVSQVNPFPRMQTGYGCRRLSSLPSPKRSLMVYTVYRADGTVVRAYDVDKADGLGRLGATPEEAAPPPVAPAASRPPR